RVGKWLLNVGARVDWLGFDYQDALHQQLPARQKGVVSPKFNLSYNWNAWLQFYAKAGKGFHSNDVRAVIANRGLDVLPAAYGTDLGVICKPVPGLLLNAAVRTISRWLCRFAVPAAWSSRPVLALTVRSATGIWMTGPPMRIIRWWHRGIL